MHIKKKISAGINEIMKTFLLGGHGRLGQKIAQIFTAHNALYEIIEREHTCSMVAFHQFLKKHLADVHKGFILDVSLAESTYQLSEFLIHFSDVKNLCLMVGTTGHSEECLKSLHKLSTHIPVCIVPNFSKGIFLFNEILNAHLGNHESLKSLAKKLGFKIQLIDRHHQHKKDAPSGTAKFLNESLQLDPSHIVSIREGDIVGIHTLSLKTDFENLEITHHVTDRSVFAEGAYELSRRFIEKNLIPGMYHPAFFDVEQVAGV